MRTQKLILVEYYSDIENNHKTFELFDDIERAFDFAMSLNEKEEVVTKIDLVEINEDNIFYECGCLNYEDNSELIQKGVLSEVY